jgi:hypothetical protein
MAALLPTEEAMLNGPIIDRYPLQQDGRSLLRRGKEKGMWGHRYELLSKQTSAFPCLPAKKLHTQEPKLEGRTYQLSKQLDRSKFQAPSMR